MLRFNVPLRNRVHAGQLISAHPSIQAYRPSPECATTPIVLALPRGGVPVACEIAKSMNAPLDLMLVRKLGVPFHEEVAMGAIASGDVKVLNEDFVRRLGITKADLDKVVAKETAELKRRSKEYRGDRPSPDLAGRTVILVDDGIATGATMKAAIEAVRRQNADKVIVAVPVGPPDSVKEMRGLADEVICLHKPEPFHAVGLWYGEFPQTSDKEVIELLTKARAWGDEGAKSAPAVAKSSDDVAAAPVALGMEARKVEE